MRTCQLASLCITVLAAGCSAVPLPSSPGGDLLIVTSFPDTSGFSGTSFLVTGSLDAGHVDNRGGIETPIYPYVFVHGDWVFTTSNLSGDDLRKYVHGADGHLTFAGQLTLESASFPCNVLVIDEHKAYVSLLQIGRIVVFDPTTMERLGQIDLPPELAVMDGNPDPAVMRMHGGKVLVGLMQLRNLSTSYGGADVLAIDPANDQIVGRTRDARLDGAGRYGWADSMLVGPGGDLYVYCLGSGGAVPGQRHGFLRIRAGSSSFDPDYVFDLTELDIPGIEGDRVGYLDAMTFDGTTVYAVAQVPALASNPPDYVHDRAYQPVALDLLSRTATRLDLPASNGYASKVSVYDGLVLFGLASTRGVGVFTFDPATGAASPGPRLTTEGDPSMVLPL